MKKVLLVLVIIVSAGLSSVASNNQVNLGDSFYQETKPKVSAICKLIQLGDVDAVKNLIDNGTNINQKSCGLTPLMYAARQNKSEIVKLLISRGVKLKIKSDKGLTALQYAEQSKATESYNLIAKALHV